VARVPLGEEATRRHGASYWLVARPDLQAALVAAVRREPLARLVTATAVLASRDGGDDPRADAGPGPVRVRTTAGDLDARLLVGADGVHSAVRRAIGGASAAATGKVAFRATAPAAVARAVNGAGDVHAWMSPRAHLVHYPMRGGERVNLVAVVDAAADERETGAIDWNHAAPAEAVLARFADFPPSVRTLLAAGEDWRRWPLATVDPAGPWRRGRTVLVGDAAHAMVPFLAQGAAMALEDAVVLADFVAGAGDVEAALTAYERARRPRVRRVWAAAARSGEIYHLAGAAAAARDLALSLAPAGLLLASFDWLYGWRPAAA
jgi:salicylate hydroxylase